MNSGVAIAGVWFKNPVITASGTFGHGEEYADFVDLNKLGGVTVKGVSTEPWKGNKPPRVVETYGGMLNAVGLQNPGVKAFLQKDLPYLRRFDTNVIVNICGHTVDEYAAAARMISEAGGADMLEVNISCPNIQDGGMAFGSDPAAAARVIKAVRETTRLPVIAKLSPNVTDITEIAKAAESEGADCISLINTVLGMKIDVKTKKPVLGNVFGGLSGPAIKPIAVRMVWQTARAVSAPIIGMGGVSDAEDAIEFLLAGASLVAVGSANFFNPTVTVEIIEGIEKYMLENGFSNVAEIRAQTV
ncbi:MAG: dihydroorotate dehydrogenase [Clostridiales bacterium]|jgi:dihydroorotate dehydrogenase (NAD+) catalytic subunit|nr:dihydroorotate dehydrogenase [Clostridiales bacterium]